MNIYEKKTNDYSNKGITLMVLIISIIILIILAGVVMATITGDEGLYNKASEAVSDLDARTEGDNIRTNTAWDKYNKITSPPKEIYATVCTNGVLLLSNNEKDINAYISRNNTQIEETFEGESYGIEEISDSRFYAFVDIGNTFNEDYTPKWHDDYRVTKVIVLNPIYPTSTSYWFYKLWSLESIENINNIITKNTTDMSYMFEFCTTLSSLDLSSFDTRKVTNMAGMFCWCQSLPTVNVSSFDTSNVTDMSFMFGVDYDEYLMGWTSLDVSNFDTSNVTNMACMFLRLFIFKLT